MTPSGPRGHTLVATRKRLFSSATATQSNQQLTLPFVGTNAAAVTEGSTPFLDISHIFGRIHRAYRTRCHPLQHFLSFEVLEHPPPAVPKLDVYRAFPQPAETLRSPKGLWKISRSHMSTWRGGSSCEWEKSLLWARGVMVKRSNAPARRRPWQQAHATRLAADADAAAAAAAVHGYRKYARGMYVCVRRRLLPASAADKTCIRICVGDELGLVTKKSDSSHTLASNVTDRKNNSDARYSCWNAGTTEID